MHLHLLIPTVARDQQRAFVLGVSDAPLRVVCVHLAPAAGMRLAIACAHAPSPQHRTGVA